MLFRGSAMRSILIKMLNDEEGASAIEYGLIAALLSVMIVGIATAFNGSLDGVYQEIVSATTKVSEN